MIYLILQKCLISYWVCVSGKLAEKETRHKALLTPIENQEKKSPVYMFWKKRFDTNGESFKVSKREKRKAYENDEDLQPKRFKKWLP